MNNKQTIDGVPGLRDLLQKIADGGYCHQGLMDRLRALLDAPADHGSDTVAVSAHWSDWSMVTLEIDGRHRTYVEYEKPAAQPQGDPVAALEKARDVLRSIIRDRAAGVHYASAQAACHQINHALEQPAPVAVVPELTSELRWILGQMCFQHIHTAQALRLMGHQIARKAEDEQAVAIYWMLGHYLKDPANWRDNAVAEMKAAAPKA
ncbi:hypothetical protein [Pseudomonas gingeri]